MPLFSSVITLSSTRTSAPLAAGIERQPTHPESGSPDFHILRQAFIPPIASLADIRANDGNLSIPLYVRGKVVSDEKGEYAVDGLKEAVKVWEESSVELRAKMDDLLKTLENQ